MGWGSWPPPVAGRRGRPPPEAATTTVERPRETCFRGSPERRTEFEQADCFSLLFPPCLRPFPVSTSFEGESLRAKFFRKNSTFSRGVSFADPNVAK